MKFPFDFHPEAEEELANDILFLNERRSGHGDLFFSRFDEALTRITETPEAFQLMEKSKTRRRLNLSKPFRHYVVYYDFDGERVRIITVYHTSRGDKVYKTRT